MIYNRTLPTGDAGEYFLAYYVTRNLGWPCRLLDVDIGVDAEIEILDESGNSNGDVIKVQIKSYLSRPKNNKKNIHVKQRHIKYWKNFCTPLIVCYVDLFNEAVYWKQITATETFESGGKSNKVSFCLIHDKLTSESKGRLRELSSPISSEIIEEKFNRLREAREQIPSIATTQITSLEEAYEINRICSLIDERHRELTELLLYQPWRISMRASHQAKIIKEDARIARKHANQAITDLINGG